MQPSEFRSIALKLPDAVESAHMSHPDFRVGGKVFASLGYPDEDYGMIMLPMEEQQKMIEKSPKIFAPATGAWGRRGSTLVNLSLAKPADLRRALTIAWKRRAPQSLLKIHAL